MDIDTTRVETKLTSVTTNAVTLYDNLWLCCAFESKMMTCMHGECQGRETWKVSRKRDDRASNGECQRGERREQARKTNRECRGVSNVLLFGLICLISPCFSLALSIGLSCLVSPRSDLGLITFNRASCLTRKNNQLWKNGRNLSYYLTIPCDCTQRWHDDQASSDKQDHSRWERENIITCCLKQIASNAHF